MWYTNDEMNGTHIVPGIDDFDPAWFYAKPVHDGLYVIYTTESGSELPVGNPLVFDDAVAVMRWVRENGLRDYRRAIYLSGGAEGDPEAREVEDLSMVKTRRGQLFWVTPEYTLELGPDMPFSHAQAVLAWLTS